MTDTTSDLDARGTKGDALDQDANLDEVEDGDEAEAEAGDAAPAAAGGNGRAAADLFRESEIAADYVEGLLDILDYDGDID